MIVVKDEKLENTDCSSVLPLWGIVRADWKWWLSGGILSFFLASVLMTGWPTGFKPNLNYPYRYAGDSLFHSWMAERVIEGWIFDNLRSGYPFGSNFLDYPGSDSGNHLIIKMIGALSGNYYSALNLYFLLGFSITFIASFCVLRAFGLIAPFAFSAAMLFDFLPFHFLRLGHLFYTWYFVVPIFFYVAIRVYRPNPLNERAKPRLMTKLLYAIVFMALGSFGVYYAFFGLLMLFVVSASAFIAESNLRAAKIAVFAAFFVVVGVLLNLCPNILHRHTIGPNPEVAVRHFSESEIYGFKFVQLVLPRQGHRNEKLAEISGEYSKTAPLVNENSISSLGILGSLGLISLLVVIFADLSGRYINKILRIIALMTFVFFMFGTIGGAGSIFAQTISPSIRGWNRISVFIGFGSLLGLFIWLQFILKREIEGKHQFFICCLVAVLLLFFGFLDQTVPPNKSTNEQTEKSFKIDKEFICAIENTLPVGSAVYQLPYMPFPEVPPLFRLHDYDLATGFVHSTSLRWSYGGMKGREGDLFYRSLSQESIEKQLEVIKRLGFAGIYIDRRGFSDNGQTVIDGLTALLENPPTLTRADGEVAFFRLNQNPPVNLEGLSTAQIMEKAGYIVDHLGARYEATLAEGIDFTRNHFPSFVQDVQGLSGPEPWGRWSDANLSPSVRIDLRQQLPPRFFLVLSGEVFGPNCGQDLEVRVGSQTYQIKMPTGGFKSSLAVDLGDEKVTSVEFISPQPTSPQQLGISGDDRKLGVGFVRLQFEEL